MSGLKVMDFSRIIAGPMCGQILADLGAEVIKVERPPVGDDVRESVFPPMRLGAASVSCAPVLTLSAVLAHPQGEALGREIAQYSAVYDRLVTDLKIPRAS